MIAIAVNLDAIIFLFLFILGVQPIFRVLHLFSKVFLPIFINFLGFCVNQHFGICLYFVLFCFNFLHFCIKKLQRHAKFFLKRAILTCVEVHSNQMLVKMYNRLYGILSHNKNLLNNLPNQVHNSPITVNKNLSLF